MGCVCEPSPSPATQRHTVRSAVRMSAPRTSRERPYDPDRELVRSFAVGCGVVFGLFLVGWVVIALFWLG
jgi:hypothetical protein